MAPAAAVPRMHTPWHGSCVTSSGTHMEEHINGSISPTPGTHRAARQLDYPVRRADGAAQRLAPHRMWAISHPRCMWRDVAASDHAVDASRAASQLHAASHRVQNVDVDASAVV